MIFKTYPIIFLALVSGTFPYDLDDLSNLGQRITDDVNRKLAPLQNLGSRITAEVEENLGLQRSSRFYNNVYSPHVIPPNLPNLDNLGQQIHDSVYEKLEPVRAIEIMAKMKGGVGGVTVASHLPGGRRFVILNYRIFTCSGAISNSTGHCSGNLTPFQVTSKKDYCYHLNGYSIINNHVCIGATSISVFNNVIKCENGNAGTPAVLLTVEEFNKMCQEVSKTTEYRYTADDSDPMHVEIPNKNKYVKCDNNEAGVCVFTESHSLPLNSNIAINNVGFTQSNTYFSYK